MDQVKALRKQYWIFCVIAVVGITATIILNLVFSKKEVKEWSFGKHYVQACPLLGGYPLYWKSYIPEKFTAVLQDASNEINMTLENKLGVKSPFYKQLKGERKPGQIVIEVREAPKELYAFKKLCEPFKIGDKGDATTAGGAAEFQVTWKKGKPIKVILLVCIKKIEDGMKLMNTPVAVKLRRFGWKGVFKHELLHGIIGTNHPAWGGEIMVQRPTLTTIGEHTIKIIKKHVVPVCRQNGLLGE